MGPTIQAKNETKIASIVGMRGWLYRRRLLRDLESGLKGLQSANVSSPVPIATDG